ncbi:hypothetical protein Stsp02_54820 [Streptomyces sp. NBRC 14336]|uniref:DUF6507 family protein n=1 Tax=Streptomyces sp. NBRC 14336 TaxID=3030992 RepID=UPI0024A2D0E7|nr:DUF6507 family protein [Streptomyces sp. NBRC 14336]WBO78857.1 DUF6507 family protein [Streptomyces sp. SBE_14.2]GLW49821.1 hypothetical protein Stsp02_54820 [Streptomyces sp. NBRC 14336]
MSKWDISPSGVGHVVSTVGDVMTVLNDIITAYSQDMEGAAKAAGTVAPGGAGGENKGQTGLVAAGIAEFLRESAEELQFLGVRMGKSVNGAVEATIAYRDGDLEMAAEAQHRAAGLVRPDMPDGWKAGRL